MKKLFFTFCLSAMLCGLASAAPYSLDAPVESYTWGESMKTVMDSDRDAGWQKISGDMLLLLKKEDDSALFLRFFHDKLIAISKSHSSSKMTPEKREALYNRYLKDFTARWGKPSSGAPCPTNPVFCAQVTWNATDKTQVTLSCNTAASDDLFIGYGYASREIYPEYLENIREFGIRQPLERLVMTLRKKPEYAQKALKGSRFQITARVVSPMPLKLEAGGYEIHAVLRNKQDAQSLWPDRIVTVSGVVEGIKGDSLQLSDTIRVPFSSEESIRIDRHGKRPQGFFPAETFADQLEMAANRVEKGFSIREHLSGVRLEGQRAVVDFLGDEIPDGFSFSLEPLYADKSGDTIVFQADIKGEGREANAYLLMAIVGIMMKVTQPDIPKEDIWEKMENTIKSRKKTVINGWTYQFEIRDERNFRFSATAPRRRN